MLPPLNQRIYGITAAAAAALLQSDAVLPGEVWRVEQLILQNASGESVTVLFQQVSGAFVDLLAPKATVADGDAGRAIGPFYLLEGWRAQCSVTGTANKAAVTFLVQGRRQLVEEYVPATPAERLTE